VSIIGTDMCCTAYLFRYYSRAESALISERVKAGMVAAKACGKRFGRPRTPAHVVARVEAFAGTTTMSIRQIHQALGGRVSRSVVGEIVQRVRHPS
jgi:DNA invertase Pin-like site-specific DNA recombinase